MKFFRIISLSLALLIFSASVCFSAGSMDQSSGATPYGQNKKIVFIPVTGDSSDGSLAVTAMSAATMDDLKEFSLYSVCAYPTPGGTTPSVTGITVTNAQGRDVLGGLVSGSNTLVPTTLEKCTSPYNTTTELYEPYPVDGTLYITGGTGTASQQYTLKLTFFK